MKYITLSIVFLSLLACKKKHDCFIQDDSGITLDTIICNCHKEIITELETSPYVTDTASYDIVCKKSDN